MHRASLVLLMLLALLSTSGCASAASPAREAYILAKPHGWLDVTIEDKAVPAKPKKEKNESLPEPVPCYLTVAVNGEEYLSEQLYPMGENPPYNINTGFRFAVPVGNSKITISYNSCKVEGKVMTKFNVSAFAIIEEKMVTPVLFDGNSLSLGEVASNKVITLESIDNRLKSIESVIGAKE